MPPRPLSSTASTRPPLAVPTPAPRVGRLVPLPGIVVKEHPDRALLLQFLQELRLPLCAIDSFLEVIAGVAVPEPVRQALAAIGDNVRHLGDLVGDYREFAQLEGDAVQPRPGATSPLAWFDGVVAHHLEAALQREIELVVVHRSFLPDVVELDADLAAQALDAVVRVALHRALPGRCELRVSYHAAAGALPARLGIDVATRGGGFGEIEQGYVFAPFATSDAAQRPLLGPSVAQRLCTLLGGELAVHSRGPTACTWRLSFAAPPAVGAAWIDPLARSGERLGVARPGRVLLLDAGGDHQLLCGPGLRRAGYELECADGPERAAMRLLAGPDLYVGFVADTAVPGLDLAALAARLRQGGYQGPIVACGGDLPAGVADAVLPRPMSSHELIDALGAARAAYSARRNATSAR